jgi:hypothetical protein
MMATISTVAVDRPPISMWRQSRLLATVLVWSTLLIPGGTINAQPRIIVGARNLAMGGTGVGSASDSLAIYYNPAGMAFSHGWEVQVPAVTVEGEIEGDILTNLDEFARLFDDSTLREIQDRLDSGTPSPGDLETVLDAFVGELPDLDTTEDGAIVRAAVGPTYRNKNWGVSTFISASAGADALIDLTTGLSLSAIGMPGAIPDPVPIDACGNDPVCLDYADDLVQETGIDPARAEVLVETSIEHLNEDPRAFGLLTDIVEATISGGTTLVDNPSELNATGLVIGQAAFSYSRLVYRDKLSVGGNVKIMSGRTYNNGTRVVDLSSGDEVEDYFEGSNTLGEVQPGIDLGVMYRPTPGWSLGLSATNLNSPSFDLAGIDRPITLEPLLRGGAAWAPLTWFNVAIDLDLNEVESGVVRGLGYRYANFGAEFLAGGWFAGRVGVYRNLAPENSNPVYTGGVAFGIGRFAIELAIGAAADRARLDSSTFGGAVPNGFAAAIQFSWRPKPSAS